MCFIAETETICKYSLNGNLKITSKRFFDALDKLSNMIKNPSKINF